MTDVCVCCCSGFFYAALHLYFHTKLALSEVSPRVSWDIHRCFFNRWCNAWMEKGGRGRKIVNAAPVVHDEDYTPLPCLVSISPLLALGQSAHWHLCAARASQWLVIHPLSCWHQDSLLLFVDMSASSAPLSLAAWIGFFLIWIWKELKVALALLSSTGYCIMHNWLLEFSYYLTLEYTTYLPSLVYSSLSVSASS